MSDEIKKCEVCGETNKVSASKKFGMTLCGKHYSQMCRHNKIQPDRNIEKKCDVCGDTNRVHTNRKHGMILCNKHYKQMVKKGKIQSNIKEIKKCEVCGETDGKIYDSETYKKVLCQKHYAQMRRCGKILERTAYDKNEIIKEGAISYIVIRNRKHLEVGRAIVDTDNIEELSRYKWCQNQLGYLVARINKKNILLHRLIVGDTGKLVVDHINRNTSDCRKENLRMVTQRENSINRKRQSNNKSGTIGVFYSRERWIMTISNDDRKELRKTYKTKEEAIKARLEAEKLYYGDFAPQRHLFEEFNIA